MAAEGMAKSTSDRIDHVVVLMLENRSFDHMLGFLQHPSPTPLDGLIGRGAFNRRTDGTAVPATNDGVPRGLDPDHSHEAAEEQQGPGGDDVPVNGGFVRDYETRVKSFDNQRGAWVNLASGDDVMRCLDPMTHCSMLATLALEFAVCDCWFSSVPGETWPNRNFAHAATSDSTVNIETGFYTDPTIFEHIAKRGASWRIYFDGPPHLWCFRRLWRGRTLLDFLRRREPKIGNWYEGHQFFQHVEDEDLPNYSFIEPAHNRLYDAGRRTNSQHPGNNLDSDDDFRAGEELIRDVYQALLKSPKLFAKTLLVIVYDEQGGLYDHAVAPADVPPGDPVYRGVTRWLGRAGRALFDRLHHQPRDGNYDFKRLGVRVPAVVVSPWIEPYTILRAKSEEHPFNHASIPATLRALFAPNLPPLTNRDANAATFEEVVQTSRQVPRPNPRDPKGPEDQKAPLPDLDPRDESVQRDRFAASRLQAMPGREAEPVSEHELTEFDGMLKAHAEQVQKQLRRRPTAIAGRTRARLAARGRGGPVEARRAPAEQVPSAASPVDAFAATAQAARRPRSRQ